MPYAVIEWTNARSREEVPCVSLFQTAMWGRSYVSGDSPFFPLSHCETTGSYSGSTINPNIVLFMKIPQLIGAEVLDQRCSLHLGIYNIAFGKCLAPLRLQVILYAFVEFI